MFNCRDKTHILGSITLFRKSCLLRYNVEKYLEPDRPPMTIWGMRCAWIPNATNTHSDYVKHLFSTTTIVPHLNIRSYVNCLSCLSLNLFRTVSEWTSITSPTVESSVTHNINTLYVYVVCPKSKCTDFLFKCLVDSPEITSYLRQSMTLGKLHGGSKVFSTDHSSTGSSFP